MDPRNNIDHEAPTAPQAPVQLFPAVGTGGGADDPNVTATHVRIMREEVLDDLRTDASVQAHDPLDLNTPTKIALLGLLIVSLLVIVLVALQQFSQQKPEDAVTSSAPSVSISSIAVDPQIPPVPVPPASDATVAEPDAATLEQKSLLAEIALLSTLVKEDPSFSDVAALQRLRVYLISKHEAVKTAAQATMGLIENRITQRIQTQLKTRLDLAQEQLTAEKYSAAQKIYDETFSSLKAETSALPFLPTLLTQVEMLKASSQELRTRKTQAAFDGLEEVLLRKDPEAQARLKVLLTHPEESFATQAKEIQTRVGEKISAISAENYRRESLGRKAWLEFYRKFNAAMAVSDFNAARTLLKIPADSPMLNGGVARHADVLSACVAELESLDALLKSVYAKAASLDRACDVYLSLKKGRPVEGKLTGVKGPLLSVSLLAGADIGIRLETLSAAAISTILGKETSAEKKLLLTLELYKAYDSPAQSAAALKQGCETAGVPLPLNWSEFYRLEAFAANAAQLEQKFFELQKLMVGGLNGDIDALRDTLAELKPLLENYEKTEPLDAKYQKILTEATRWVSQSRRLKWVLQNGSKPGAGTATAAEAEAEYSGQTSDQISDYKDSQNKTDVGIQWGLKLGASGGLQRALIRFDGLENAIGKARVIRATLEMYQIDSPQTNGAVIGLFRLKRPWLPDSGSWLFYNTDKKLTWETAGAGGDKDSEAREDCRTTLDQNKNVWRAWDVTSYVQDILKGKIQNNGFLMRVINSEPDFHIRFYPESDVENIKDAKLRPRLVLVLERGL